MRRRLFRGMAAVLAGSCTLVAALRADVSPGPAPVVPNLLVEVSRDFANAAAGAQSIDQAAPFSDRKGKLSLAGMQHTHAVIGVEFVPNARGAVLDLLLVGGTDANTTARQGPVALNLTTRVSYIGRKRVIADENGFREYGPAVSDPALDENTLNCLSTRFRGPLDPLVRNVATRVFNRKRAQVESDILRDARTRVNQEFDKNVIGQLATATTKYHTELRGPYHERGIFPQRIQFVSTNAEAGVRALLADPTGKSRAFAAVPEIQGHPALAVRIEESLLNNVSHTRFAGKTFTDKELDAEFTALLKPLLGTVQTTDPGDKPFSITFPEEKPIEFHFDKQMFRITLRCESFTTGDRESDDWDIAGNYKLTKTPTGLVAERTGVLQVYRPGKDKLGARELSLRILLEKKFGRVLKPQFEVKEITFKAPLDRIGVLVTTQVESNKGWLVLAWKRIAK